MAKQLVNPIERHVEKAVLGIAALLLIGVLVKFVFTSPNLIELGQEPVTPGGIDARLAQKANEILKRIQDARPAEVRFDPLYDEFETALSPLKTESLRTAVAPAPPVPLIDSPEAVVGRATLVHVQKPEPVEYTFGRNTLLIRDAAGNELRKPANWLTLSALFDVRAQSELQRKNWGATKAEVIFLPPEVERRKQRGDGGWSEGDWQPLACWPSFSAPPPPPIRLITEGDKTVAHPEDQKAIEKYVEEKLAEPAKQLEMIRPLPPVLVNDGNPWKFPIVTSYEDVLKQDDEYLYPKEPHSPPDDRYGFGIVEAPQPVRPRAETPAQIMAQELEDAKRLLESAKKSRNKDDAWTAYNRAITINANREAPADLKNKAAGLMKEAEQLANDIKREEVTGGRGARQPDASTDDKAQPPREHSPRQQIWAHDWAEDSLESGATYQYRMRFRVLNRLAGFPESFENPQDATTVFVAGEWSDPTPPITIPDSSYFFAVRDDAKRREIGVEFLRWYDGVWVKSGTAKFNEGDKIAFQTRVQVPSINDRTQSDNALVPFEADAMLIDIDFARPYRERKPGASAAGVKFGPQAASTTAAFVDSRGRVFERSVTLDKAHPTRRSVKTYTPPR